MEFCAAPSFQRDYLDDRLSEAEKNRCISAVHKFADDPWLNGLNFERLGSGEQNHCSIRASQELRVIIAVPPSEFQKPKSICLVRMGHHDEVYGWSDRKKHTSAQRLYRQLGSGDLSQSSALIAAIEEMPFNEWKISLYPDQEKWVKQTYSGEARIYGNAGSGKTVIGMHRAAELGRRYPDGQILFTTYISSLLPELSDMYSSIRGAPTNVEFHTINQLAVRLVRPSRRIGDNLSGFRLFCESKIPGTALEAIPPDYLYQEINLVINARSATLEEYTDTGRFQRAGRSIKLDQSAREDCWNLKEAWESRLRQNDCISWSNLMKQAAETAEKRDAPEWRCVIVDEGQDISAAGMRMLRALVAGNPENRVPRDGLLLLADDCQRIYSLGFQSDWAKLKFSRNRTIRLDSSHRSSRQILEAAHSVVGNSQSQKNAMSGINTALEREKPVLKIVEPAAKETELGIAKTILNYLIDKKRLEPGNIGIFMQHNAHVDSTVKWLGSKSFPCLKLSNSPVNNADKNCIRVGTFDRSKGMEFQAVLILRLGESLFPGPTSDADQVESLSKEDRTVALNRLYVGMTRARDFLYLIAAEGPCKEIERASEYFDWHPKSRPLAFH